MKRSQVCIDASLIVRTLVPGRFSLEAERLLSTWQQTETTLLAPALFAFAVTSTLQRRVYQRALSPARGEAAFAAFLRIPVRLSHRQGIFPLPWELAKRLNRSRAYDTVYLAIAQLTHSDFWTADEKLYHAAQDRLPWVKWVGNVSSNGNGRSNV